MVTWRNSHGLLKSVGGGGWLSPIQQGGCGGLLTGTEPRKRLASTQVHTGTILKILTFFSSPGMGKITLTWENSEGSSKLPPVPHDSCRLFDFEQDQ